MIEKKFINEFITAYVDNELRGEDLRQFEVLLKKDPKVKQLVEQEKLVKQFVQNSFTKIALPDHLRNKIDKALQEEKIRQQGISTPTGASAINPKSAGGGKNTYKRVFLLAAATVIFVILIWVSQRNDTAELITDNTVDVEYITFVHFQNHSGSAIPPSFVSESVSQAQLILKEQYGCSITVPELAGAEFAGVVYADFHDGFHTPLLSYRVSEDDYIYIFAFEMKDLNENPLLSRHSEAANAIIAHEDIYIIDYEGMHVVSWKWHDVWYSAVSKHHGETLAAMLPH